MATQQQILAGIIQGEAGTPADQFGVASTIYNRAIGLPDANGVPFSSAFGGGSYDPFAVATAPGQFEAYPRRMQPPSANAMSLAGALLDGSLPEMGNTGNALYYNAPGSNPAYASGNGNSFGAGTNQYSDAYNQPPSANFSLANQTGPAPATPQNGDSDALSGAGQFDDNSMIGQGGPPDTSGLGIQQPDFSGLGSGSSAGSQGDGSGASVSVANPPGGAPVNDDITNLPVAGVNAPIGAGQINPTAPSSNQKSTNQGQPLQITGDLPNAITQAGNASSKATSQLGQDVQQTGGTLAAAGTSWLGSIFTAGTNVLARSALIALGLVLLLGAFMFFYAERRPVPAP